MPRLQKCMYNHENKVIMLSEQFDSDVLKHKVFPYL